jgi:hypothetical protein
MNDRSQVEPQDELGVAAEVTAAEVRAAEVAAAAELPASYFEIYKMTVEMADRVSARRGLANSFFLTINTTILGILGTHAASWYLAVAGIILCISWWALLKSYRDLNAAKFKVILAMEKNLPAQPYGDEWDYLRSERVQSLAPGAARRAWTARYRELGVIERTVPWVFALVYLADIVRRLAG